MRNSARCFSSLTFLAALLPLAVPAHHSRAYFGNEIAEITGELVGVDWRNPHIGLTLSVRGEDGSAQEWQVEGNSIYNLQRRGIARARFEPGRSVTITGRVSTREDRQLLMTGIDFGDGTPVAFTGRQAPAGYVDSVVNAAAEARGIFRVWSMPAADRAAIQAQIANQPFTDEAVAARASWDLLDNFSTRCEPEGMPRIMINPHPFEFIDQGDRIILRTELYDTERTIHMSDSARPEDVPASRLGYSTGTWDDGALVVRTSRIDWPYFDRAGTPQTEAIEIIERFVLSDDQSRLDFDISVTDPATFTRPAHLSGYWLALGESILRYDCQPLEP